MGGYGTFSAHHLFIFYICSQFHRIIIKGFRVTEPTQLSLVKLGAKVLNSVKNVGRVLVLVFSKLSDDALYLYQVP